MAATPNDGYRRFEYADGKGSCKFWEIETVRHVGIPVAVRYGRIGKAGVDRMVNGHVDTLIRSKIRKGYVEVTFT